MGDEGKDVARRVRIYLVVVEVRMLGEGKARRRHQCNALMSRVGGATPTTLGIYLGTYVVLTSDQDIFTSLNKYSV